MQHPTSDTVSRTAPCELRTARTLLRSYRRSDLDTLAVLANDKDIGSMTLRIPFPYRRQDADDFFDWATARATEGHALFAVEVDGQLAGTVGLHPEPQHHRAEIGYWLGKAFWGRGLVTEAAAEVVRWAFEEQQFNRIYAAVFPENIASRRVLEKLGFTYEGTLRQHQCKWGVFKDEIRFGILADEWRKRQR